MEMHEYWNHRLNFLKVRDILAMSSTKTDKIAYRLCYKKSFNYYADVQTALDGLRKEAVSQL